MVPEILLRVRNHYIYIGRIRKIIEKILCILNTILYLQYLIVTSTLVVYGHITWYRHHNGVYRLPRPKTVAYNL